ncbi:hypothetical protein PybrP1_005418, partial [[Pythium] brassicae (nom. inval.)]
ARHPNSRISAQAKPPPPEHRMTQSLAFAAPLPEFVFPNVAFEASVKLVDEQKAVVAGVACALSVTLRFHDSFDIVAEQAEVLELTAPAAIDPASGHAVVSVLLKSLTAANDARPFCLEVRAADSAIESVFSTPVTVVKEKLRVVQQPPDVWFKDEGGREKCMTVTLVMDPAPGAVIEDRVIPLDVRLLYESGNPVVNQGILRLFPDMRPNMSRGRVSVSFRIDDVSKNHQGQSFVLEVAPEPQASSRMFQDIAPTRSSVVAVRSKRNKRKLSGAATRASPRSRRMLIHGTPTNTQYALMPHQPGSGRAADMALAAQQQQAAASWSSHLHAQHAPTPMPSPAHSGGAAVEWKLVGFEIHGDGSQNVARPIYRCPHCKRLSDVDVVASGLAEHNAACFQQQQQQQQHAASGGGDSPKTLAALISERQRPVLTISPYMNKVTGGDDDGAGSQASDASSPGAAAAAAGNLFASNAFRNQMEISEVASHLAKHESAHAFLTADDDEGGGDGGDASPEPDPHAVDAATAGQLAMDDDSGSSVATLAAGVGSALFTEMSSMGISLDQFDKPGGGGFNPLADFGGLGDEDQLGFYTESQNDVQTQVVFHALEDVGVPAKEQVDITTRFTLELQQDSDAVHSLPKYQHNLVMLREDALMYYWSQSLQSFGVN